MQHNILSGLQSSDTWSGNSATCSIFIYFFSSPATIFGRHGVFQYCILMYFFSSPATISGRHGVFEYCIFMHFFSLTILSYHHFLISFIRPPFKYFFAKIFSKGRILTFVLKNILRKWVVLQMDLKGLKMN